ncbi:MAG: hypothetical protein CRU78_11790 [Candidatus Accumulibacter phosphatis]|uniref:Uncharacterized protein n=1 Tax=Candidatus Accumulibacter phosphatis TaxID=327160 RepID=A0A6A7RUI2_9PROT|nr:hypothetical protein [Candidatus Accumulibacter phosphatis]
MCPKVSAPLPPKLVNLCPIVGSSAGSAGPVRLVRCSLLQRFDLMATRIVESSHLRAQHRLPTSWQPA